MNTTTPRKPLPDAVWQWIEQHTTYDNIDLMQRWLSGRPITEGQLRAIDEATGEVGMKARFLRSHGKSWVKVPVPSGTKQGFTKVLIDELASLHV